MKKIGPDLLGKVAFSGTKPPLSTKAFTLLVVQWHRPDTQQSRAEMFPNPHCHAYAHRHISAAQRQQLQKYELGN